MAQKPGSKSPSPQTEAKRLLDKGFSLILLSPNTKRPVAREWQSGSADVTEIEPEATGYGIPLGLNNLVSIDVDHEDAAGLGLHSLGFSLDALREAGVATSSTRPGSGGRITFQAPEGPLRHFVFRTNEHGTVMELRAGGHFDCVPGVRYSDSTGSTRTQSYSNGKKFDDAKPLPKDFLAFWESLNDIAERHKAEQVFATAAGGTTTRSMTDGAGEPLSYPSDFRTGFNRQHRVEDILTRHGYVPHEDMDRWAAPKSTGHPGVRKVPGTESLWRSDHGSDPLRGTFDAWAAYVVLDHAGDMKRAEAEWKEGQPQRVKDVFAGQEEEEDPEVLEYKEKAKAKREANSLRFREWAEARPGVFDEPLWILEGFMVEGFNVISGQPGIGKTTSIVPLAALVAGLFHRNYPLTQKIRRKVIYVSEYPEQVNSILWGLGTDKHFASHAEVGEWFKIVDARMLSPAELVKQLKALPDLTEAHYNPEGEEFEILPLIVLDTAPASLLLENENDNSEVARAINTLKQGLAGYPIWSVNHQPKNAGQSTNIRGASAWKGEAVGTYGLEESGGVRFLVADKVRAELQYRDIRFDAAVKTVPTYGRSGRGEMSIRWSFPAVALPGERAESRTAAQESSARPDPKTQARARVVRYFLDHPAEGPVNARALRDPEGANLDSKLAPEVLNLMVEDGVLIRSGTDTRPLYSLNPNRPEEEGE